MRPVYAALEYSDAERIYKVSETLDNGLLLDIYIQLHSEKFLEYQKEILQEFVADFLDKTKDQPLTSKEIEQLLESELQKLNTKLQSFADKLRDVPKCDLRGYVQVIVDQAVKTWMIGKTTLMIFRDEKVYSVLENSYQEQTNIDQFSDFIGGEIERGDVFMKMQLQCLMCLEIFLERGLKNLKSDFCLLLVLQVLTYQELFLQKEEEN